MALDQVLAAVVGNLYEPMLGLFALVTWAAACVAIVFDVIKIREVVVGRRDWDPAIAAGFVAAVVLLNAAVFLSAATVSAFSDGADWTRYPGVSVSGDSDLAETGMANSLIKSVFMCFEMLGAGAFCWGIGTLRSVALGKGQATMSEAVLRMVAGGMLWNIGPFVMVVQQTVPGMDLLTG
jgi:hypothetical protein